MRTRRGDRAHGQRRGESSVRPLISVVVPVFNEQQALPELHARLARVFDDLGEWCEAIYVDDGSEDRTPVLLAAIRRADPERVGVLTLSRNFGHQAAISAGLNRARGRAVVVLDGDGQDPPELIPGMLDRWRAGVEVVSAVRRRRREGWIKRLCYHLFYRLLRMASEVEIPLDAGDFSLMDRRVVRVLRALPERARFVRGLRAFVGFRQEAIEYDRPSRIAGRPKFTTRKLLTLAADGLISFSGAPLRLATWVGLTTSVIALGLIAWVLVDAWGHQTAPRGWASTLAAVLFMGAVQLLSLGIIGEYVRLIFVEAKGRPSYVVSRYRKPRRRYAPLRSRHGAGKFA